MSESSSHMRLVRSLSQWVAKRYFDGDTGHILVDSPHNTASAKPPSVCGFVPDVYAGPTREGGFIIGEAKTARDIENRHTRAQLLAFLKRCGEDERTVLIMAVPWEMERFTKALLEILKCRASAQKVSTVVLEKLPG